MKEKKTFIALYTFRKKGMKFFMDYNNYTGYVPYPPYDGNSMESGIPEQNLFNPAVQYEQAYMYYRYLSQQMDYKIKCKEYENLHKLEKK